MSETIIDKKDVNAEPVETVEAVEKPYTFRLLGAPDMFLMFKIISKIGIREFNACFENDGIKNLVASMMGEKKEQEDGEEKSASVTYIEVILEVADVLIKNISKCENDIYQMLSQTSNLTVDEIKAPGNSAMFLEMIIDFIKKEEFRDFIKVVSKLFK